LHPKLQADARVQCFEGVNARDVTGSAFEAASTPHSFGFVTGDLSFITSTHVLPTLAHYLAPTGHLLLLIKPQFELQPAQIGKGGIVKDERHFAEVETRIRKACREQFLQVRGYFQSPIKGGNGNTEFFVWAVPSEDVA
jgi:23S rRNA (cytidine1920-2'-O)/16S rRNA (cytidine1409-2'-O)-methyltransferase